MDNSTFLFSQMMFQQTLQYDKNIFLRLKSITCSAMDEFSILKKGILFYLNKKCS